MCAFQQLALYVEMAEITFKAQNFPHLPYQPNFQVQPSPMGLPESDRISLFNVLPAFIRFTERKRGRKEESKYEVQIWLEANIKGEISH